jgi:hypothetical protein
MTDLNTPAPSVAVRALTESEIRAIIGEHAVLVGALYDTVPSFDLTVREALFVFYRALSNCPELLRSVVATGADLAPEQSADWTLRDFVLTAIRIAEATFERFDGAQLLAMLKDEVRLQSALLSGERH